MAIHWRDIDKRLEPGAWDGLLLSVDGARDTGLAVSIRPPCYLRVSVRDTPVMWVRIWDDYYGYDFLRVDRSQSLTIVPPISFQTADKIAKSGGNEALRLWARHFAQGLSESTCSPLIDGDWLICPHMHWHDGQSITARDIESITARKTRDHIDWDLETPIFPLRGMSSSDSGRVKAWRKLARNGELPPVLLYWISGLVGYVVLDGHDRLLAAQLEGRSAPFLTLNRVSERSRHADDQQKVMDAVEKAFDHSTNVNIGFQDSRKFTNEKANRILLDAFTPVLESQPTITVTSIISDDQWRSEVRAEAGHQGADTEGLIDVDAALE